MILDPPAIASASRAIAPAAAFVTAIALSEWYRRRRGLVIRPALWKISIGALLAARAAFVLSHLDVYADAPMRALDVRDGGLAAAAAMFAALAIAVECTRHAQRLQKAIAVTLLAGGFGWLAAQAAAGYYLAGATQLPAIDVRRLDGTVVPLRALNGRPVVINLWASWCPPCRAEMPLLGEAQARNPGVEFIFLNQGEDGATIRAYLAGQHLALRNVLSDRLGQAGSRTGAAGLPTTLFFNQDATLSSRKTGELTGVALAEHLAKLGAAK